MRKDVWTTRAAIASNLKPNRGRGQACAALLASIGWSGAWAQTPDQLSIPPPLIVENQVQRVSERVYVILDGDRRFVPNVGIVVGNRATLVIDPGLGTQNGELVLRETRKVSTNEELYLVSTHYHAEHSAGLEAFPSTAIVIRSREQQREIDESGLSHMQRLSQLSPTIAVLLEGVSFRSADILFDDEFNLDLGGATVRMYAVGPAHTFGDTVIFVEEDGVAFAGDVAMQRYPLFASPFSGVASWRKALAALARLDATVVVPSHGPMGDSDVVENYDRLFSTLQSRVAELKQEEWSIPEIAELLTQELAPQFTRWGQGEDRIGVIVRAAYSEIP